MNVEINLYQDWMELIHAKINELQKKGFVFVSFKEWGNRRLIQLNKQKESLEQQNIDTASVEREIQETDLEEKYKENLIHIYFDFDSRLVVPKPRKVKIPSKFSCPSKLKPGYDLLLKKVEEGTNLFPHLSRQIFKTDFMDGMLFDWGIQHFHLGLTSDGKRPSLIQGTKEVLYAIVTDDNFYVLVIEDHGHWASKDLLRIVKNDFPEILAPYKIEGILGMEHKYTERDHIQLRNAGINTMNEIDGDYYISPGGGINSAKGSAQSTMRINFTHKWYREAEKVIISEFKRIWDSIPKDDIKEPESIKLKMPKGENDRITVISVENNISVILFYNEERNGFKSISVQSIGNEI